MPASCPLLLSPGATRNQREGPRRLLWLRARPFIGFYKTGLRCGGDGDTGQEGQGCLRLDLRQECDRLAGEAWGRAALPPPLGAACPSCRCLGLQGGGAGEGRAGWMTALVPTVLPPSPASLYCLFSIRWPERAFSHKPGPAAPKGSCCTEGAIPTLPALLSKLRICFPLWNPLPPSPGSG